MGVFFVLVWLLGDYIPELSSSGSGGVAFMDYPGLMGGRYVGRKRQRAFDITYHGGKYTAIKYDITFPLWMLGHHLCVDVEACIPNVANLANPLCL